MACCITRPSSGGRARSTRAVFPGFWLTSPRLPLVSTASRVSLARPTTSDLALEGVPPTNLRSLITDKPSAKFGEALRDQVEERLKFFETGEPPSKNAEAIRKVLEAIALEDEDEEGSDEEDEMRVDDSPRKDAAGFPILPLIENSPPVQSPKKKSKKRKDMDVDSEEEEEAPRKKVKLSKEERKVLRKELKRKKKEEEKAASVRFFSLSLSSSRVSPVHPDLFTLIVGVSKEREKGEEGKEGKETQDGNGGGGDYNREAAKEREEREEREKEKEQGIVFMTSRRPLLAFSSSPSLFAVSIGSVCFIIRLQASGIMIIHQ